MKNFSINEKDIKMISFELKKENSQIYIQDVNLN